MRLMGDVVHQFAYPGNSIHHYRLDSRVCHRICDRLDGKCRHRKIHALHIPRRRRCYDGLKSFRIISAYLMKF